MKINRQQLTDALAKVKPGLANNEMIEQSTHFIFDDKIIRTFSGEMAITHQFETGLVGAVPAKEFYSLFTKIPDEQIDATQDGTKFIFKGKGRRVSFNIDPDIRITNIEAAGPKSKVWMKLPENFCESIKYCSFSVSRNMTEPEMTCVAIDDHEAFSCDRVRATKIVMETNVDEPFLIPGAVAQILNNYNPHLYYLDENWLHFINKEKTTFSCNRMDREYPFEAIRGVFEFDGKKIQLPSGLKEVLDRSKILVSNELDEKETSITFAKGKVVCEASGIFGEIMEETESDYKGNDLKITIHPELLMEILQRISTAIIGEDKVLFKDDEGFEHVILLVPDDVEPPVEATKPKPKSRKKAK